MLHFKDKTALVTGSGKGIGKAIALQLCEQGAQVVLNGRNRERLEETYREFSEKGYRVMAIQADVTLASECEMLIRGAVEAFGKIDILIANAGISMQGDFEDLQPGVFARVIESNVYGSAFPVMKALPFIKQTKGSIIFISSIAGLIGLPSASAYSAGKMMLTALAQSLRAELADSGMHIGIVYVGFTRNDPQKRVLNARGTLIPVAMRPSYLQQTPEQVAGAVLRLIRKRKSGTVLSFTGKLTFIAARVFPSLVLRMIRLSRKKLHRMFNTE